ncbi:hypothetical protein VNO78_20355 [Psophocarpus tetragonolobus]|uniref:Uncharacterized protein n=1 Tax=Psophocarpus tetragonolobus TaxID=3891 RepID=A0AAN9S9S7_PSOTE
MSTQTTSQEIKKEEKETREMVQEEVEVPHLYAFHCLLFDLKEHPMLLAEPFSTLSNREKGRATSLVVDGGSSLLRLKSKNENDGEYLQIHRISHPSQNFSHLSQLLFISPRFSPLSLFLLLSSDRLSLLDTQCDGVIESINKCDVDIQREWFSSIMFAGSTAPTQRLKECLEKDFLELLLGGGSTTVAPVHDDYVLQKRIIASDIKECVCRAPDTPYDGLFTFCSLLVIYDDKLVGSLQLVLYSPGAFSFLFPIES